MLLRNLNTRWGVGALVHIPGVGALCAVIGLAREASICMSAALMLRATME